MSLTDLAQVADRASTSQSRISSEPPSFAYSPTAMYPSNAAMFYPFPIPAQQVFYNYPPPIGADLAMPRSTLGFGATPSPFPYQMSVPATPLAPLSDLDLYDFISYNDVLLRRKFSGRSRDSHAYFLISFPSCRMSRFFFFCFSLTFQKIGEYSCYAVFISRYLS